MQFAGQQLKEILCNQVACVEVIAADGTKQQRISSRFAANTLVKDGIVGIGHAGRIRFLRPADLRRQAFASEFDIKRIKQPPPRVKAVQRNHTGNRLDFAQQPSFAQTGHLGNLRTIHTIGAEVC